MLAIEFTTDAALYLATDCFLCSEFYSPPIASIIRTRITSKCTKRRARRVTPELTFPREILLQGLEASFPSENGERKRGDVSRESKSPFSETSTNPEIRDARWRVVHAYFSGRGGEKERRRSASGRTVCCRRANVN